MSFVDIKRKKKETHRPVYRVAAQLINTTFDRTFKFFPIKGFSQKKFKENLKYKIP